VKALKIDMGRYWYYCAIALMFVVGWCWPSIGLWMKSVNTTPYLVFLAFFLNSFALSPESLFESVKQWRVLLTALIITFGISPALVFAARRLLPGGDGLIAHGFQIVSVVPTLFVSAVVLTRLAKGNTAVALFLTVSTNLLAVIIAPTLIKATLGSNVSFDVMSTSISMIYTVILPTILGQLARKRWETWANRHAGLITVLSQCTILLFIITGVSALPRSIITPAIVVVAIIGDIILHAILLGIGRFSGALIKVDEPTSRALTFCSAQKSFAFNVLLCEHIFAGNVAAFGLGILPGIIYYLLVLSVDSMIAQWWSMRK
jgi:predicted Na+-dependent transporter